MKIFSQNSKMKKSKIPVYNFGIPAFMSKDGTKTCPNAGACAAGCYARSGTYQFSNVKSAYEERLELTKSKDFATIIGIELNRLIKKHKNLHIRVHDSGDFYSKNYQLEWYRIAQRYPEVKFYAYTKQIAQSKELNSLKPENFTLIFSYGGKQDHLIDANNDRHSKVFESTAPNDYVDASNDDMLALTENKKVALIYHGTKNFSNTLWSKVG